MSQKYIETLRELRLLQIRQTIAVRYRGLFLRKKMTSICIWRPYHIGDILMLHPLGKCLKEYFPNARVTYIAGMEEVYAEVAGRIPSFDCVVPSDRDIREFILKNKRERKYDLVLYPFYEDIYITKARANRFLPLKLLLTVGLVPPQRLKLDYRLTEDEVLFARSYKEKIGKYVIIADDESAKFAPEKKWVASYWQELINLQSLPVIVVGLNGKKYENCIDMKGKLTIHQCAALIKDCHIFVGTIAGPYWFTAVFEKYAVVINGGFEPPVLTKHPKSYHLPSDIECSPCLKSRSCQHDIECMKLITPELVNSKIREVLDLI